MRQKGTLKLPRRLWDEKWRTKELAKYPYGYFGYAIKNPLKRRWHDSYVGALWREARYAEFFRRILRHGLK